MARILIIDDDPSIRELLRVHLNAAGYEVDLAEDAVVGGHAVLSNPPDVVLSDVNMPYMNGFELLEAVRADAVTHAIPFVFLTSRGDDETFVKAKLLGASGFVTKPVRRDELLSVIESSLKKARA
jgi:DNA-binding response OmpR family regulator